MVIDLSRRVTHIHDEFERAKNSPDSKILIEPQGATIDAATTLTINSGAHYFNQITGARERFEEPISLRGGDFLVVESKQLVSMPRNAFGQIHGKGRALFRGIMAAPGKIDPSFSGHLRVYIFNGGRADVVITPGEVIASVAFFNIETPYDGKAVGAGFPSISPPPSFFGRFVSNFK
ncbi:hypothetical protein [uncultured Sphaerotilus sp.]|uniref:dCTP deaminase domain-containing protein n=1 Tax=uncultured Sphaerotilus sp. TaxID=474984 RepID=UPI0030CA52FD